MTPIKEPHLPSYVSKQNWLRAAVLGANDGVVSMSGLVFGVAGATSDVFVIATAGIAGIIAGAISMAAGEYVSVSSSRDMEKALLEKEKYELKNFPERELEELAKIYQHKGLSKQTARKAAIELTRHDPLKAHFDAELRIDPENLTNPWHAGFASALSFTLGGLIPLISIVFAPSSNRLTITIVAVIFALVLTGTFSAKAGGASIIRAVIRVVIGGLLAMGVTYEIGKLFKVSGII